MIKKWYFNLKRKMYFVLGVYAIIFILLAAVMIWLDYSGLDAVCAAPSFLFTSRSSGAVILSTVAGSLMTMLTISFSIMMVVLTIYGSQLSPRSLQDFLGKKITLRILGFFMGSLIFSIISLFAVKDGRYDNDILSPAVAILLLITAVIIFAYFIHYISKSIQVSLYIQNLVKKTSGLIDNYQRSIDDDPEIKSGSLDDYADILESKAWEIASEESGFIQYYDEKKLLALSEENDVVIACVNMVGVHVLAGDPLFRVFNYRHRDKREDFEEQLLGMVYVGDETNLYEDIGAGTKKLVEIAVRALSPAVNDPSTAVFCIEQIGFLLQKAAKGLEAKVYFEGQRRVRLIVQGTTFERLLFQHFYQIAHYGLKDIVIIDAILGALIKISKNNGPTVREQIWKYGGYLMDKLDLREYPEYELDYIRARYYQLAKAARRDIRLEELLRAE